MAAQQTVLERKGFGAGEIIFREGDKGNVAYVVQTGSVEVYRTTGAGEKVLGTIAKGGIFGEMALIDDEPRMASARAIEETTVFVVSRMAFSRKMENTDPFIRGLLNILASNLRSVARSTLADLGPAPTQDGD